MNGTTGGTTGGTTKGTGPVAVLVNPTAGRGRHREVVARALSALRAVPDGGPPRELVVLAPSTAYGAEDECRQAVRDGAAALVAVGGDGTVHLALQAVAGQVRDGSPVPFGVVPTGTGNDFATEVGLPADPVAAAKVISAALSTGQTRRLDLGRVSGLDGADRWFGVVLGAGFDALVNERANAMRWPRGPMRYEVATYAELLFLRPRRYTLTLDGQVHDIDGVLVAVGNMAAYGGGMRICPAASMTDGLLDIVVGKAMTRATLARLKARVRVGTHVLHPKVLSFRARTVGIAADGITAYADGERVCPLPVTIRAEPGALALLG
jgi:diacylglycerol kinase (ATP)